MELQLEENFHNCFKKKNYAKICKGSTTCLLQEPPETIINKILTSFLQVCLGNLTLNVIIRITWDSRLKISMERLQSCVFITSISIKQKELRLLVLDFKVNYIQTNSEVNLSEPFVCFWLSQRGHALVPTGFHAGQLRSCHFYPQSKYTLVSTSGQVGARLHQRGQRFRTSPHPETVTLPSDGSLEETGARHFFYRVENLFLGVWLSANVDLFLTVLYHLRWADGHEFLHEFGVLWAM